MGEQYKLEDAIKLQEQAMKLKEFDSDLVQAVKERLKGRDKEEELGFLFLSEVAKEFHRRKGQDGISREDYQAVFSSLAEHASKIASILGFKCRKDVNRTTNNLVKSDEKRRKKKVHPNTGAFIENTIPPGDR